MGEHKVPSTRRNGRTSQPVELCENIFLNCSSRLSKRNRNHCLETWEEALIDPATDLTLELWAPEHVQLNYLSFQQVWVVAHQTYVDKTYGRAEKLQKPRTLLHRSDDSSKIYWPHLNPQLCAIRNFPARAIVAISFISSTKCKQIYYSFVLAQNFSVSAKTSFDCK